MLVAPDLLTTALGLDNPQTYLVLSQNSDELRPSGGFLSTYGWLSIRNGRVENYDYSPSTADSPHPPPDRWPIEFNCLNGGWAMIVRFMRPGMAHGRRIFPTQLNGRSGTTTLEITHNRQ